MKEITYAYEKEITGLKVACLIHQNHKESMEERANLDSVKCQQWLELKKELRTMLHTTRNAHIEEECRE